MIMTEAPENPYEPDEVQLNPDDNWGVLKSEIEFHAAMDQLQQTYAHKVLALTRNDEIKKTSIEGLDAGAPQHLFGVEVTIRDHEGKVVDSWTDEAVA